MTSKKKSAENEDAPFNWMWCVVKNQLLLPTWSVHSHSKWLDNHKPLTHTQARVQTHTDTYTSLIILVPMRSNTHWTLRVFSSHYTFISISISIFGFHFHSLIVPFSWTFNEVPNNTLVINQSDQQTKNQLQIFVSEFNNGDSVDSSDIWQISPIVSHWNIYLCSFVSISCHFWMKK